MPVISNITVTQISQSHATLEWQTDIPCLTQVHYGLTPALDNDTTPTGGTTEHKFQITSLFPNRKYYFKISAQASKDKRNESEILEFTTKAEDTSFSIEEALVTADARVRQAWQGLITVAPDGLNEKLDVMSGYLNELQHKATMGQLPPIAIEKPATVQPSEAATNSVTETESNKPKV